MKEKGFTLTELLGVITIIAVLCLITFPSIISQIKGKEETIDKVMEKCQLNKKTAEKKVDLYWKEIL